MDSCIIFNDIAQKINPNELNSFRKWIIYSANKEGFSIGELIFTLCDDAYLLEINIEFLDHDSYTDIITFDYSIDSIISGEIYISLDRIYENAQRLQQEVKQELSRVIIHGVLHLCDYADKEPKEKLLMTDKENYYLSLLPDFESNHL